jgi:isochorismate hydrolase
MRESLGRSTSRRRRRLTPKLEDHALTELRGSAIRRAALLQLLQEARFEDEIVVAVVASIEVRADGGDVLF